MLKDGYYSITKLKDIHESSPLARNKEKIASLIIACDDLETTRESKIFFSILFGTIEPLKFN
ncbi:hypothetical protein DAMA08_041850 [Martiniozyma asiatica (nom. inval.)]|nr:hypothetical protein DAMA08_041850 [Martiniozyma asiatica]